MSSKVDLRGLFLDLQDELEASLGLSRRNVTHPTAKGDATELRWVTTLQSYLPLRYKAEKAFVVDHEGSVSDQIDVVVFDRQYCPFLMNHNGTLYVPAESVYAVLEVKQELSRENVLYAGQKAASVRALKRTNAPVVHAGGRINDPKPPFRILSGLLTLDSSWQGDISVNLQRVIGELGAERHLDLGCCIRHGSFEALEGESVKLTAPDTSLVFFILRFLQRLQALGTVPAIELDAYLRQICGSEDRRDQSGEA